MNTSVFIFNVKHIKYGGKNYQKNGHEYIQNLSVFAMILLVNSSTQDKGGNR